MVRVRPNVNFLKLLFSSNNVLNLEKDIFVIFDILSSKNLLIIAKSTLPSSLIPNNVDIEFLPFNFFYSLLLSLNHYIQNLKIFVMHIY